MRDMDAFELKQNWMKKLCAKNPEKFRLSPEHNNLYVSGCSQFVYSIPYDPRQAKFFHYDRCNRKYVAYHSYTDCVEFKFWNESNPRDYYQSDVNSYEDLEKKAMEAYYYLQNVKKELRKQYRIQKIKEL